MTENSSLELSKKIEETNPICMFIKANVIMDLQYKNIPEKSHVILASTPATQV
jgi:hypothetical protein